MSPMTAAAPLAIPRTPLPASARAAPRRSTRYSLDVEVAQVPRDVAHRHAAGVQAEDAVVQAGQPRLALLDQRRRKRAPTVARRAHLDRSQLSLQRLRRRAVAVVAGAARRRLPRRIAQMLGQIGAQRRFDHPARQLREQHAAKPRARPAAKRCAASNATSSASCSGCCAKRTTPARNS
jgi:hypothetical protein